MAPHFSIPAHLIIFLFSFLSAVGAQSQTPDRFIVNTQQWPPYEWEKDGVQGGVAVEVLKCAFTNLKLPLKIRFLPWQRAQTSVKAGRAHGFFPASRSEERDTYAVRSDPIVSVNWVWFTTNDSKWDVNSPEFKSNAKIAAEKGSYYSSWLRKNGYNVIAQPDTHEQMALMLIKKRVDAFLANDLVFLDALKDLPYETSDFRMLVTKSDPLGVYFSKSVLKKNPDFLMRFNAAVSACSKN